MKYLILLAACAAGCATSSFRDRVASDMVSIRERVSSVESGLAGEVSARLLKVIPDGVKAAIIDAAICARRLHRCRSRWN